MKSNFSHLDIFDLKTILQQDDPELALTAVLNETPDIIYVVELETRSIVYINARVKDIMGITEEKIYEKGFDVFPDLVHPHDYLKRMEQMTRLATDGVKETAETEIRMKVGNGSYHWFRVRERVFTWNDNGDPDKLVGICLDINEQKLAEQELKNLSRQVIKNNRELVALNEELELFNRITTKEFLETLQTMYTCLEYITSHDAENFSPVGKANIRKAQGYIQKMRLVAHDITAYLQLNLFKEKKLDVDLNRVFDKAFSVLQKQFQQIESSIQLTKLPIVKGHPVLLGLLFQNMLENAMKFRKENMALQIKVDYAKADEINFHPLALKDTTYHIISVRDNGIGFDQKDSENIFTLFTRLHDKTKYRGSGLGLAVCKKVMQIHGGFIEAQSTPNEGSVFTCFFPGEEQ